MRRTGHRHDINESPIVVQCEKFVRHIDYVKSD